MSTPGRRAAAVTEPAAVPPESANLLVGVIDSAVPAGTVGVVARADFSRGPEANGPPPRHGAQVAAMIAAAAPRVGIAVASVFDCRLACSAAQVAEALDWLCRQQARIVNMSFGLRQDRAVLREACRAALARGACLVAASPARGTPCYPARYPGVIRATGDARCAPGEISRLDSAQADFGGFPGDATAGLAGASSGCAAVTAALARLYQEQPTAAPRQWRRDLAQRARYQGPETRLITA